MTETNTQTETPEPVSAGNLIRFQATDLATVVEGGGVTDAAIDAMAEKYGALAVDIEDDDTVTGYDEAKAAARALLKRRTAVEHKRKELKQPALDFGRALDAEAKRIIERIRGIEQPLLTKLERVDTEIERRQELKRQRVRDKIKELRDLCPPGMPRDGIGDLAERLETCLSWELSLEFYGDLIDDATAAKMETESALMAAIEAEKARAEREAQELALRGRVEAERKAAEEQAARDREAREAAEKKAAEDREAREAVEKELAAVKAAAAAEQEGSSEGDTAEEIKALQALRTQERAARFDFEARKESEPEYPSAAQQKCEQQPLTDTGGVDTHYVVRPRVPGPGSAETAVHVTDDSDVVDAEFDDSYDLIADAQNWIAAELTGQSSDNLLHRAKFIIPRLLERVEELESELRAMAE